MRAALRQCGLTLIELIVVVAVAGILLTLAAPSFRDFILMQRLKGVNAQLVTDMQFARGEAAARGQWVRVSFRSDAAKTCYSIYVAETNASRCNCLLGPGSACTAAGTSEVRTVQTSRSTGVKVEVIVDGTFEYAFAYDHVTGGIVNIPTDDDSVPIESFQLLASIDADRALRTTIGRTGRITVCAPGSLTVGAPAC